MTHLSSKVLLTVMLLTLSGCDERGYVPPMTNEQIIAQTKQCQDAGLDAVPMVALWDGATRRIVCNPRRSK